MPLIFSYEIADDLIKLGNAMVNICEMLLNDPHSFLLFRCHIEAADGFNHI